MSTYTISEGSKEFSIGSGPNAPAREDIRVRIGLPDDAEVRYCHTGEGLIIDVIHGDGYIVNSVALTTLELLEALVSSNIAEALDELSKRQSENKE